MNKRQGFAPILIIILAAVLAVGGIGAGLAWKTDVLDKILPPNIKEFLGKEVTPTDGGTTNGEEPADGEEPTNGTIEDPTKDWKSYTSTRLGFSAKYPADWKVIDNPPNVSFGFRFESPDATYDLDGVGSLNSGIYISVVAQPEGTVNTGTKAKEWVKQNFTASYSVLEELLVDGNSSVIVDYDAGYGESAVGAEIVVGSRLYAFTCLYLQTEGSSGKDRCVQVLKSMLETVEFLK